MLYEAFYDYLRGEAARSAHTVTAYRHDVESLRGFLKGASDAERDPRRITLAELRMWVAELASQGLSTVTIVRKIQSVRAFFHFLVRRHGMVSNPASRLVTPRLPKVLPEYVRQEETMAKIDGLGAFSDDFTEARDALMLTMLYSTGMRAAELVGLRDAAVDTSRCELKVLGKRNKERIIPIGPGLCESIESYRSLRDSTADTRISPNDRQAAFFVRKNGKPLYRKLVYNVVHQTLSNENVHATRLSPHVLRHSFATDMLNSGAPISSVQQLLGHASLASTQIYTHVTYSELQNNYKLAHPRALKKGGKNGN